MRYIFVLVLFSVSLFGQAHYSVEKVLSERPSKQKPGTLVYTVFENGDARYEVVKQIDFDLPHYGFEIFANGGLILTNALEKDIEIYSLKGELVKLVDLGEFSADYEIPLFYAVDKNEAYFVLPDHQSKQNINIIVSSEGKIISRFDTPFQQINGIAYSSNQKLAVISKISWQGVKPLKEIVFLNKEGKITNISEGAFSKGVFTDAGFWAMDKKEVRLVEPNGQTLFLEKNSGNKVFLDLLAKEDDVYVVNSGIPIYKNGEYLSSALEIIMYSGEEKSGSFTIEKELAFDRLELVALNPVVIDKKGKKIKIVM